MQAAERNRPGVSVIDAHGMLVIPGLINAHYHSHDMLSKGRFEDMPFDVWMLHSQPALLGETQRRRSFGRARCSGRWRRFAARHHHDPGHELARPAGRGDAGYHSVGLCRKVGIRVVFSIAARDLAALDIEPLHAGKACRTT